MTGALSTPPSSHVPVMLTEVLEALSITPGERHIDGTFGAGGYSQAMLAAGAMVEAFDRDPHAIAEGQALIASAAGSLRLHHARFSEMEGVLNNLGVASVDGVVLDIGVSSMQLDRAERGFSFRHDGALDMRMSGEGESAADFVNRAQEEDIADVLYLYGEERQSRRLARAIVANRPVERTAQLAAIVRKALGHHPGMKKDPATRTFQALRIYINAELDELQAGLSAAERLLKPGGRLVVVSFHSLEDRIVKRFFKTRSGKAQASYSRHLPVADHAAVRTASFERPAKPIKPDAQECERNPRARSAVLRWALRTSAAAWPQENLGGLAA